MSLENVLHESTTKFEHYQVVDLIYNQRPSRVLFSGWRGAAQAGIPRDGDPRMLFDYNQRFMELVDALQPKTVLQIGGGVFTLPTEIINSFPEVQVDAVEQDTELQKIAKRFFGLKPNKRLKIIIGDGRECLSRTRQTYDLILLDAFTHSAIPDALATKEFVELLAQRLGKSAVVAANVISAYHGPGDAVIKQQYATYNSVFKHVNIYPADRLPSLWISQNFILAATNNPEPPKYNLRFSQLAPPPTNISNVKFD